jgi:hypothetical protein
MDFIPLGGGIQESADTTLGAMEPLLPLGNFNLRRTHPRPQTQSTHAKCNSCDTISHILGAGMLRPRKGGAEPKLVDIGATYGYGSLERSGPAGSLTCRQQERIFWMI